MKAEYDFSNGIKNPYAARLKAQGMRRQITININNDAIDYFRSQSEKTGIPYQSLINLYLVDCAKNKREIDLSWK